MFQDILKSQGKILKSNDDGNFIYDNDNYKIFNLELKITNSINEHLIYFKLILNENDLKIIRI